MCLRVGGFRIGGRCMRVRGSGWQGHSLAAACGSFLSHLRLNSQRRWAVASAWSRTYNYSFKPNPLRGSA